MDRYQSAFYAPLVSDLTNFGAWSEAGAKTSTQRATDIWTQNLAKFKGPEHGALAASNIEAFIETRKQQGEPSHRNNEMRLTVVDTLSTIFFSPFLPQ